MLDHGLKLSEVKDLYCFALKPQNLKKQCRVLIMVNLELSHFSMDKNQTTSDVIQVHTQAVGIRDKWMINTRHL